MEITNEMTQNEIILDEIIPSEKILTIDQLLARHNTFRKHQCLKYYTNGLRQPFTMNHVVFPNRILNASG